MSRTLNARKGKVARLPFEVREVINEMMRDGATATELNAFLKKKGHATLNGTNWTNWRHGGHQDWLKEQDRLDIVRKKHESIRRELAAGGFSVLDKAIFDTASALADSDLSPDKVAYAIASLKGSVATDRKVEIADRRAHVAEKALALAEDKFELHTCELFLKWYDNQKAREIAEGKGAQTVKVGKLRELIFGKPPDDSTAD